MLDGNNVLHDRKIAILAADGFDETQLFSPKKVLEEAGAEVVIVSIKEGVIKAWDEDHWGRSINVDMTVNESSADQFDALVIPGGDINPDTLRNNPKALEFVKDFINDGKSVASICRGTQVLLDTGLPKCKPLEMAASSVKSNLKRKGDDVVVYKGIISSQCPYNSLTFNQKMIEGFSISPRCKKNPIPLKK